MIKMSESRCELRTSGKIAIGLAKAAGLDPAVIDVLPKGADLKNGTGIPDGALVLSRSHLKYVGFPLHPLFQFVWSALDLHPMQLSPNSYLQLSAFLAFGLQEGVCIYPSDFFHFHDCVRTQGKEYDFHFISKTNCKFSVKKPSSHKNWQDQPLLITRNWEAPELKFLKIRSTFATSAVKFAPISNPERIQLLKTCFAGKCLDMKKYSTPTILLKISQERSSIIYSHFKPLTHLKPKPGLEGKEVATRIFDSLVVSPCPEHVAEWESMMARQPPPLPYSLPSKLSKLDKKRSGSSALQVKKRLKPVLDPSAHSSTFSSLESIPLNKRKNVALEKDDGTCATEEEEVVGNSGACLAAADASALQKEAPQEMTECEFQQNITAIRHWLTEDAQNEEQLKADLEKQRQRVRELESQLNNKQVLRKKVQCNLSKLEKLKNDGKRILMDLGRHLKFKKIVANPDVLDAGHRLKPGDYESCDGMKPSEEDEVEQDEEDDPEDKDDQDEENDQEEDDPKDEDDREKEDECEQDGNDDHDQDECSLGGRDVDNNLFMPPRPQNSNMIRVETSPNPKSNQETSDPALLFDSGLNTYADPIHGSSPFARPSCEHVPGFSHMEGVSSGLWCQNQNEIGLPPQNENESDLTSFLEGGPSPVCEDFTFFLEGGLSPVCEGLGFQELHEFEQDIDWAFIEVSM